MKANEALTRALDVAGTVTTGASLALSVVELYRALRDHFGAPPDLLTDAELAALLQARGTALKVDNDSWLVAHGFPPGQP